MKDYQRVVHRGFRYVRIVGRKIWNVSCGQRMISFRSLLLIWDVWQSMWIYANKKVRGIIVTSGKDAVMKLFIKCLKESLRHYFGRDSVVILGARITVIIALGCLAGGAAVTSYFFVVNWLTNKIVTSFHLDDDLWYVIFPLCAFFVFFMILGIFAIANDISERMKKERQTMLKKELGDNEG